MTPQTSMTTETGRIASQLRRSYEGIAWHGPSLKEILNGVESDIASRRPYQGAHTIWELVLHVAAWATVARRALTDNIYVSLDGEADWPVPQGSWPDALAHLEREQKALIEEVKKLTDVRLNDIVSAEKQYSVYFLLHGVIQHNLYHAGQMALLKKA